MDTKNPLTKRIEIHFDRMTERNVIEFIEAHKSKLKFVKELCYAEWRRYRRNPTQYKADHKDEFKPEFLTKRSS